MRIVQINGGAKGSTGKIMMGIAEVARAGLIRGSMIWNKMVNRPAPSSMADSSRLSGTFCMAVRTRMR